MEDNFLDTFMLYFACGLMIFGGIGLVVFVVMAFLGKIESKPFHIKLTSDKKVTTNKLSGLEKCANCGRDIGKLEKTYVFKNSTICAECYPRLKSQEQIV